jgi:homoserine dehydrogenase
VRTVNQQLWYSAAVGGALPALETLANLPAPVREIRGILNGTCGAVLDYWSQGKTRAQAVTLAQAAGFAEADPARDLSGADSADKLALLMEAAFGVWISPQDIATEGIQFLSEPRGVKLIASAHLSAEGIHASVAPQRPEPAGRFLSGAQGAENRIELELQSGEVIRLTGQGAGRWPTAVSVMGDLHEITRLLQDSTERLDVQRRSRRLAPRAKPGASDG